MTTPRRYHPRGDKKTPLASKDEHLQPYYWNDVNRPRRWRGNTFEEACYDELMRTYPEESNE